MFLFCFKDITVFIGPVVHSENPVEISCFPNAAVAVKDGNVRNSCMQQNRNYNN